jgi:hypothetical protein
MHNEELKKQFQVTLYGDEILITTSINNEEAFQRRIKTRHEIKIGWYDWIETKENALNYHECCGVLLLFGIEPPAYNELSFLFISK